MSAMEKSKTFRLDDQALAALEMLASDGRSQSDAVRRLLIDAVTPTSRPSQIRPDHARIGHEWSALFAACMQWVDDRGQREPHLVAECLEPAAEMMRMRAADLRSRAQTP